jgi:hypothetical protein
MPKPLGKDIDVRMMCDSVHAGDKQDQTLLHWFSYLL